MTEISESVCLRMKSELTAFRFLDAGDLDELPCYFQIREIPAGGIAWKEGDPCNYLAFIVSGKLEIKKETEFPGKQVIVGVYSKGAIAGEICILERQPREVSAVALEDTMLVILTCENFDRLIKEHPLLGIKFLKGILLTVSKRLKKSFDRLAAIF